MLESGCFNLAEIQRRYGHANLSQTATYLHARAGSTAPAQAKYDEQRRLSGTIPVLTRQKTGKNGPRLLPTREKSRTQKLRKRLAS